MLVDQSMVPDAHHALVDLEQELCLCRVVHCDSRPDSLPVLVQEGAGKHFLELVVYLRALDHFRKTGGVDVMLYLQSALTAVVVDEAEPFLHSGIQLEPNFWKFSLVRCIPAFLASSVMVFM